MNQRECLRRCLCARACVQLNSWVGRPRACSRGLFASEKCVFTQALDANVARGTRSCFVPGPNYGLTEKGVVSSNMDVSVYIYIYVNT